MSRDALMRRQNTSRAHNAHTARQVFGEDFILEKCAERAKPEESAVSGVPPEQGLFAKVSWALCNLDFRQRDVKRVVAQLLREQPEAEPASLIRAALGRLTPTRA